MDFLCLVAAVACLLMGLTASAQPVPSPWEQPTAALAEQIAGILGPGQARLTIRNLSAVPTDEIPVIRRLLEEDLKARGVLASGAESANTIRVTLSENVRERLWVAEVVEGNETRVTMVRVGPAVTQQAKTGSGVTLRRQTVLTTDEEVLATLEIGDGLVAVEAEEIVIYGHAAEGWRQLKRVGIGQKKPLTRDPRGVILPLFEGGGFEAFVPGMECKGSYVAGQPVGDWTVRCRESDDPWPVTWAPVRETVAATQADISITPVRAFYNATRNYFTGVISPEPGVDSPPFYSAAWLFRSASSAPLVTGGIDGKVQAVENGALRPVSGTRDWGSDFAVLHSGCGTGTQIVASGSGEAAMDSLRAYEVPALEAVAASDPLAMDGTVTALGTAPDGKSVFAVVRSAADKFEVDRVTASCNE